jgi:hypothetical protein
MSSIPTPVTAKLTRVVFAMYNYLQNVKTNVSNARRKRPKVIKSLKSNFISITPIPIENEVSSPCNTIVP